MNDSVEYRLAETLGRMRHYKEATWGVLTRRIGHRGSALLFFGLLNAVYAFSLIAPSPELSRGAALQFIAGIVPLWVWGLFWGVASVLCFIDAFRDSDRIGFVAAISVKLMWGVLYLAMAILGVGARSYVGAALWLCLAGWVAIISTWPNPPPRRRR